MGRLLAEDGSELATVEVESDLAGGKLALSVSSGKGQLLDYYFQRGRRAVTIDRAGRLDRGRLHTSWSGGRRHWSVQLVVATRAVDAPISAAAHHR